MTYQTEDVVAIIRNQTADIHNLRIQFQELTEYMKPMWRFLDTILNKREEGKSIVFVDDKLVEWIGKEVEAGVYRDQSYAVETLIKEKRKEKKE